MTDGTSAIGTIHFALMALLAAVVVIGIVWGVRAKRRQVQGQKEFEAHAEEAGVALNQPDVEPAPPAPAPAAPSPPPLADQPDAGTPPVSDESRASPIADEPTAAADGGDAPLTQIKGLGPKVAVRLHELGITTIGQVAALGEDDVRALDVQLGPFAGRIARDRWIEQARFLAAGDRGGFEAVFGRL